MSFDPKFTFWLGFLVSVAIGISTGAVHLTDIVPADYIKPVTGWIGFFAFAGSSLLTAMTGMSSAKSGPLAPPPTIAQAQQVMKQAQESAK